MELSEDARKKMEREHAQNLHLILLSRIYLLLALAGAIPEGSVPKSPKMVVIARHLLEVRHELEAYLEESEEG